MSDRLSEVTMQRDALAGVLMDLVACLPKGRKALSSILQSQMREAATLVGYVIDREDIDHNATGEFLRKFYGCEYRTTAEELQAKRAASIAKAKA